MIRQMTAKEASAVLEKDPDALYLDVRTPEEYAAGHAAGSWNVPAFFFDPSRRLLPNEEFERVVQATVPKGKKVILGCQSGVRSQKAAEMLERLGYTDLTNLQGGFGGARDPSGRVTTPGWRDSALPVESGESEGRSYEDLKRKV